MTSLMEHNYETLALSWKIFLLNRNCYTIFGLPFVWYELSKTRQSLNEIFQGSKLSENVIVNVLHLIFSTENSFSEGCSLTVEIDLKFKLKSQKKRKSHHLAVLLWVHLDPKVWPCYLKSGAVFWILSSQKILE